MLLQRQEVSQQVHSNLLSLVSSRLLGSTSSNVDSKTTTFGGNLSHPQLEELMRSATMHNANLQLIAGVLTLKSNN